MDINNIWNSPHNYSIFCNMKIYDGKKHSQTMLDNQYKKHSGAHREKMRNTPMKPDPYANGEPLTADQLERQMSYMNKQRDTVKSNCWLITQDKKLQIFYDTYLK